MENHSHFFQQCDTNPSTEPSGASSHATVSEAKITAIPHSAVQYRAVDFVFRTLAGKRLMKEYVGLVNSAPEDDELEIQSFHRNKPTKNIFTVRTGDVSWIEQRNTVDVLGVPVLNEDLGHAE